MKKFLVALAFIAIGVFGTLGYENYIGEAPAVSSDSISPVDSSKAELPEIKSPVAVNNTDTASKDTVK